MLWILVFPAVVLALLSLRGDGARAAYAARRLAAVPAQLPPASVIVPVKGDDEELRQNLAALAALDYPDYELLVVAHRADDIPPGVLPDRVRVVLAGNRDDVTGDKILNLMAAVRSTRKRSEVFAFADSDGRVPPVWLRALVAPLAEPGVGASTGFRWHTPDPAKFWSLARSLWNAVAFGTLRPGGNRFAWGGAMAIRKETFFELGILEAWKGTVSDDYVLASAVRRAGLEIAWAPGATVAAIGHTSAREFFGWIRRQMTITRVYDPGLWWTAAAAHLLYCGGMIAAAAGMIEGSVPAAAALALQLVPGMVKGVRRARTARKCMPGSDRWFARYGWTYSVGTPLGTWLWMAALTAAAWGNTIVWRGRRYHLRRPLS